MRPFTLLGFLALALALAAPAAAQRGTLAPPGNSGVDEYKETIPTSRGNRPTDSVPGGGGGGGGGLSQGAQRSLDRLGADGQAVADLAKRPAPPKAKPGDRGAVSSATRAVMSFVVEAIERGSSARRSNTTWPVLASTTIAAFAWIAGGSGAWAAAGAARASSAPTTTRRTRRIT